MARHNRSKNKNTEIKPIKDQKPENKTGSLKLQRISAILLLLILIGFFAVVIYIVLLVLKVQLPLVKSTNSETIAEKDWVNPDLKDITGVRKQMAAYFVNTLASIGGQPGKIVWFVTPVRSLALKNIWTKTGWPPQNQNQPSDDRRRQIYAEIDSVIKSSRVMLEGKWARWIPEPNVPVQYQFSFRGHPGLILVKIDKQWFIFGGSPEEVKEYGNPPIKLIPPKTDNPEKDRYVSQESFPFY